VLFACSEAAWRHINQNTINWAEFNCDTTRTISLHGPGSGPMAGTGPGSTGSVRVRACLKW
jgi:hypothetical protein